ncbi:MAG: ribbon-helix-helix domain-containing protein [Alphaproteobacteria bacterium]|jgi:predicted DNA-binding ribbon-helix-helix protein|nr:ribbon-helix-helix domain-containing protein [Alphaproteobacteria bacterium]
MKKISVSLSGHQTSITLESEFFDALQKLSIRQNRSVASIINEIDSTRPANRNLSSAVRVWVLQQTILRFSDNS